MSIIKFKSCSKFFNFFTKVLTLPDFKFIFTILAILSIILTCGCATKTKSRYSQKYDAAPKKRSIPNLSKIKDAIPKIEEKSKYGNPKSYVVFNKQYKVLPSSRGYVEKGIASWYGTKFHGHKTSNGEVYDMFSMTAAHKTLPIPTYAEVTNLKNGKKIIVRINDRGPFHGNRVIDLSYAAAHKLGILATGTGIVEVKAIEPRIWLAQQNVKKNQNLAKVEKPEPINVSRTNINDNLDNNNLRLQLGAFKEEENALTLAKKVKNLIQHPVQVAKELINNNTIFKVQIGPLDKNINLKDIEEILASANLPSPIKIIGSASN